MADLIRHLLNRKRTIFRFPSFSLERKVSEKFKAASIGPPRGCLNA
jgi:hypothetical protein